MILTPADLEALATGDDEPAMVATFRAGQFGKHALFLRAIMDSAQQVFPDAYTASGYEGAYDLLASVQAVQPEQVAAVLGHPHTGSWAHACLRLAQDPGADPEQVRVVLGELGGVAAAAAIRAGVEFETVVPLRRNAVLLPTLGQAVFPADGSVTIRDEGRGPSLTMGDTTVVLPADHREDGPGWLGLREITAESAGVRLRVDLDDLGPYRAICSGVSARLDADGFGRWSDRVRDAWMLLVAVTPGRAASIAEVLATLVPQAEGEAESATSRDAFGSIQLTENDAATFAEALVHESQHSKLNALLDLCPLYEEGGGLHYSPARDDARPLHGLLHATYAYLGIADFWRRHRHVHDGESRANAHVRFAMAREQTLIGTHALLETDALNADGTALVAGMDATARGWVAEEVPGTYAAWAEAAILDHRLLWRLNNLHYHPDDLMVLAKAWITGEHAHRGAGGPEPVVRQFTGARPSHIRLRLRYAQLLSAQSAERFYADLEAEMAADVTDADLAHLRGDHATAARLYAERIAAGSDEAMHWAGLALALHGGGESGAMVHEPHLVRAVYGLIGDLHERRPDPRTLAAWLDGELEDVR
ncbi:HEXXH motif domain-containing protein [Streptosporangium sp. KLBMP 9127]|nr:HEXXH motif domain-containing protein [Streptosporangium sp. KLBMP 9127]